MDLRTPYSVFLMHRRTDLWGPDGKHDNRSPAILKYSHFSRPAQEFDPDRFLDDRLRKYFTPNPFIFVPFNAGPRICLGQQVRQLLSQTLMIRILTSHLFPVRLQRDVFLPRPTSPAVLLVLIGF